MSENKECNDIVNIAKNETDFSYNTNEEQAYYVDTISYRKGIGHLENKIKEQSVTIKLDNYHQYEFISYDEKRELANELIEILRDNVLKQVFEENLNNYNDFLEQLRDVHELNYCYNFLKNISDSAEVFKNQFTSDIEVFKNQLKSMDRQVTQNILVKKLVEVLIDMFFAIPDMKKASSTTKLKAVVSFARRMKFVPYLGIVCLVIDIVMIIREIQMTANEIYTVENQCALLESFYSRLSYEVSCIMSNDTAIYDNLYYSSKDYVYLYNTALSYMQNNNYNFVSLCMNILLRPRSSEQFNINSLAQISRSDNDNTLTSSYFNHVKNLLLKANFLTFIQTSNYSSALVNEILKESHKNYSKYSIVISNSHDINNYIYRSQQHIFQELRSNKYYSNNIVFFRGIYKANIKEYSINYLKKLLEAISQLSDSYQTLSRYINKDNKTLFKNINKYFLDSIYGFNFISNIVYLGYDTSTMLSNELKAFFEIVENEKGGFLIGGKEDITKDYILSICDKFKVKHEEACKKYKGDQGIQEAIRRVSDAKESRIILYPPGGEVAVDKYAYKIKKLNGIIEELQLIGSCFYVPVKDEELINHIKNECSKRCDILNSFYKNNNNSAITTKDNSLSYSVNTCQFAYDVCKYAIEAEYSLEYKNIIQNMKGYIDRFQKDIDLFQDYVSSVKISIQDIIKLSWYKDIFTQYDIDLIDKYIYDYICAEIKYLLPLNISTIERVFEYDYFKKICAIIYRYYMVVNNKNISLHLISVLLQSIIEKNTIDILCYFDSITIDNNDYNFEAIKQLNANNITRYSEIIYHNLKYITLLSECFSLQKETDSEKENNNSNVENISTQKTETIDFINLVTDWLEEKFTEYDKISLAKATVNETVAIGGAITNFKPLKNVLLKLYTYMNFMDISGAVNGVITSVHDNIHQSTITYHAFKNRTLEYNKKIKFYKTVGKVNKEASYIIKENIKHLLPDIFKSGNRNIITKDNNIVSKLKNLLINIDGKSITQGIIKEMSSIVIDQIYSTIDVKKAILDRDMLVFNYINKRKDIPDAYWNQEKGYFTIPLFINQNYIMSDFRAMVVGGAHFDNSCFINGTSSGIFVQDNEKVSRSFLEIMVDYLEKISIETIHFDELDKYIIAYCNVINYLYQLSNIYNQGMTSINELYSQALQILSSVGMSFGNGFIKKVKDKPQERNYKEINGNYYIYTDNFSMKNFVIQLKLIGESNYKFYETQQQSQDNNMQNTIIMKETQDKCIKNLPLLLGSLIYDEQWFRSEIDINNGE